MFYEIVTMDLPGNQKKQIFSIAVLPFVNMSADADNEYFSDGITEEIINALAKIQALKVTSRTSSFFFKHKKVPIPQIGKALKVATILEGSVRLSAKKVRITAQLIDVETDVHYWSETFDRSLNDLFKVQDEVSLLIADKIRAHTGHFDIKDHLVKAPDIPVEIYKKYLMGKFLIQKMNKAAIEEGIVLLKELVEQKPDFSLSYLHLHLAYFIQGATGMKPSHEAFAEAQPFFTKALELDENLPECHHHLAGIQFWQHWNLKGTFHHLNKAIAIKPSYSDAYQSMAPVLCVERKFEAALKYINTAIQLDPFLPMNHYLKGIVYFSQEQYGEARLSFAKSLEYEPNFVLSQIHLGYVAFMLGELEESYSIFLNIPSNGIGVIANLGGTTLVHAARRDQSQLEKGIEGLKASCEGPMRERVLHFLIQCYCAAEYYELAMDVLEQGIKEKHPFFMMIHLDPILKPLNPFPRYKQLLNEIHKEGNGTYLPKEKYKKSSLKQKDIKTYIERLEQFMIQEKPYLDAGITIRQLAQMVDIHPNNLSQLVNEHIGQRFSDYINSYRLEKFKSLVKDPNFRHLTLLTLAYESGFNSKTVFNTFFKKMMGKTPRAYWKEVTATQ